MIKKQRRDNGETDAPAEKDTAACKNADSAATENTEKVEEPTDTKAENEAAENEAQNQPSEVDVLKIYLKQSLEELKKQKDENEKLKTQVTEAQTQLEHHKEKLESIVREYENFRRRTSVEKENLGGEIMGKAVLALLPALDNLERAMPFADSNPDSFKKGVEMTLRQLSEAFASLGVEEIEAQGAEFNPEVHEAVMHVEDDSVGESIITDVFQKGYRLGDRVVRHSVVKVAN